MSTHIVRAGECLSQIAHRYGFASHATLYNHPDNAELKKLRKSPHILHPGDRVVIPDKAPKEVVCATGATHQFQMKRPRRKLKVVLQDSEAKALDGVAYRLVVGDLVFEGESGGDGSIAHDVPIDANEGELTLNGLTFPIRIGHLNPVADAEDGGLTGVHARLVNLGFASGDAGEATAIAVRSYRRARGLDPDGGVDDALTQKLEKEHGC